MYVDILKALGQKGPSKPTQIMYEANVDFSVLKDYLSFLIKQGLIEERAAGKGKAVYANTTRGMSVLRFFGEPTMALSTNQEDDKISPVP
jgi:predicted transcriptional regulator